MIKLMSFVAEVMRNVNSYGRKAKFWVAMGPYLLAMQTTFRGFEPFEVQSVVKRCLLITQEVMNFSY
jgi:hypothetical protein